MNTIVLKPDTLRGRKPVIEPTPGTWICGGAIRSWFDGGSSPDVDVFGTDEEKLDGFISQRLASWDLKSEHPMTKTFTNGDKIVQVIQGKTFPTMDECLDYFDFTICQFGWDGQTVSSTPLALITCLRKHLAIHKIHKEHAIDSMRRAFKYQRAGFTPCAGTLRDLAAAVQLLTPEEMKAQVEISPGGGLRTTRFD